MHVQISHEGVHFVRFVQSLFVHKHPKNVSVCMFYIVQHNSSIVTPFGILLHHYIIYNEIYFYFPRQNFVNNSVSKSPYWWLPKISPKVFHALVKSIKYKSTGISLEMASITLSRAFLASFSFWMCLMFDK